MTHGSLFTGIGGIDLGFERAGMRTLWQVEIDAFCREILAAHFPDAERFTDVRGCGKHNLKWVNVISLGFPCQDVSKAGNRAGIREGTRSGLWFQGKRIISELGPDFVLVENVTGLLTPDDGEPAPISRVLGELAEIGYDAEWTSAWASAFGAMQRRERVFVVAYDASLYVPGRRANLEAHSEPRQFRGSDCRQVARTYWTDVERPSWGVAHGLPYRLDQLRGLGNCVVPQIAEWIGRRIVETSTEQIRVSK
jgi:DNA-cytosine methyltransferase